MTASANAIRRLQNFDDDRVAAVALKAFFNLAAAWHLNADQQITLLGAPSRRTFYRWRAGEVATLPRDCLERISVLLGIYKALQILLPTAERADAWIHRANRAFGDRSGVDVMLQGRVDDLYQVHRHLDAWRG